MVDYDLYNERRQQMIDEYSGDPICLLETLAVTVEQLVDLLDWEDNEQLAIFMGWTSEEADQV